MKWTGPRRVSGIIVLLALVQGEACRHEVDTAADDARLFEAATTGIYTYYVGTPDTTPPTPPAPDSPHGPFRVRFDTIAASVLDPDSGKLPLGGSFPSGSIVVKEVYEGSSLVSYAVMEKSPSSPLAGGGWLWGEFGTDGSVIFTTAKKGNGCVPCHSSGEQRDLVRTFDLH